ncbi:hypothetical protein [Collimonas sp.]|uniref:hypothetical protein n=1 Tax=Collimonas sp. TaxID=1963772 RepID=UPI002C05855A|nr:hypothetical protein [Collimonas sp.]HWX01600.1 hypothetical protein [Collimonas sp.]
MNTMMTLPNTLAVLRTLAGVRQVQDTSRRNATMEVTFDDGLIVTIFQGTNQDHFDIWLPENGGGLAARLLPYLSTASVMKTLTDFTANAASKR